MMTSTIRKFGVGVASVALVASAAVPAFAANNQEVPGPMDGMVNTGRLGGFDRIETAIKIAEAAFERANAVEVAYVAGAADAAAVDSAAAGHLSDGPLYLVGGDNRSQQAVAESINKKYPNVQKIIAVGGTAVVSDAALKGVAEATNATSTARLSGADRYGTAAAIAEYGSNNVGLSEGNQFYNNLLGGSGSKVYLARGDNPVDALVSGVLDDAPVLLLGPDGSVPEATAAYLKKHLPRHFVALGGEKAVPTSSFMKADYDPVMKNTWLNNEEVAAAQKAVADAAFLLEGIPGGSSVNPKHNAEWLRTHGYNYDNLAALEAQIAKLESQLAKLDLDAKPELDALKAAKAKLPALKKDAVAEAATQSAAYKAALENNKRYYGVSTWTADKTARSSLTNYAGSLALAEFAQANLDDFNKAVEIESIITEAVKTYKKADIDAGGNTDQQVAAAKALATAIKPYVNKYYDGSGEFEATNIATKAKADKFVEAWENTGSEGLKGFAVSSATAVASSLGAGTSYSPTAMYGDGIDTSTSLNKTASPEGITYLPDRKTTNRKMSPGAPNNTEEAHINFLGLNAAETLINAASGSARADKIADAKRTLADALTMANSLRDGDVKNIATKEKLDELADDYAENGSGTNAKAYQAGLKAVKDAQEAYDKKAPEASNVRATINELKEMLREGSFNNGFKGYKRIEQKYSLLDGEHSNAMRDLESGISLRISQLKNSTSATAAVVANDEKLQSRLKAAYGIELTESNVEEYFAFKAPNVGETPRVSRANFKRMRTTGDALVGRAKQLINEFYALNADGFDTGVMLSWFNPSSVGKNWRSSSPLYGKLTDAAKQNYDDAAHAVWDALNSDDHRLDWATGTVLSVGFVWNSAGRNGAAQVSSYLEEVALNNRKSAEAQLAKAKVALQTALDKVFPKRYDRVEGTDRYQTSAAIAGYWRATWEGLGKKNETTSVYIANGISYIDAVAGGQLKNGPIVLAAPDGTMTDAVKQRFSFAKTDANVLTITALGGTKAVPEQALTTAVAAARDKSLQGKNFFTDATNKAADNAKADEKKADEKK